MRKKYSMTKEGFNHLLDWLDSDRAAAGEKYEKIRLMLIKFFSWRRVTDSEDLADEAINIVMSKLPGIKESYKGDPARYFLGVARNIIRKLPHPPPEVPLPKDIPAPFKSFIETEEFDLRFNCLKKCLEKLDTENRQMFVNYYRKGVTGKKYREQLAENNQITYGNFRVKIYRIRRLLSECIEKCLKQNQ